MTFFRAVQIVDGIVGADKDEQLEAWQYLHDTGYAYTLPGRYGRMATSLVEQGLIEG